MATFSRYVRVRLRFVDNTVEPSWMLVDFDDVKIILDLKNVIGSRFLAGNYHRMKLTLLNFVLPDWETSQILQNGDTIRVIIERLDMLDGGSVSKEGTALADSGPGKSSQTCEQNESETSSTVQENDQLATAVDMEEQGSSKSKKKKKKKERRKQDSPPSQISVAMVTSVHEGVDKDTKLGHGHDDKNDEELWKEQRYGKRRKMDPDHTDQVYQIAESKVTKDKKKKMEANESDISPSETEDGDAEQSLSLTRFDAHNGKSESPKLRDAADKNPQDESSSLETASKDMAYMESCDISVSPGLDHIVGDVTMCDMSEVKNAQDKMAVEPTESSKKKRRRRKRKKYSNNNSVNNTDDKTDPKNSTTEQIKVHSQTDINVRLHEISMNYNHYNIPHVKRNRFSKPVTNKHTHFGKSDVDDDSDDTEINTMNTSISEENTKNTVMIRKQPDACVAQDVEGNFREAHSKMDNPVGEYPDSGSLPSAPYTEECLSSMSNGRLPLCPLTESQLKGGAKVFTRQRKRYSGFSKQEQLNTSASNKSIILYNTSVASDTEQIELIPVMKVYNQFPPLAGPPRVGDTIAYKTLELTEDYCPEVSQYKEATVLGYDTTSKMVTLKLLGSFIDALTVTSGKFDISIEDEDHYLTNKEEHTDQKTIQWNLLLEPRLLD